MSFLKRTYAKIILLWHSLFHGMSGADKVIKAPVGSIEGVEVIQQETGGGVFADMLQEKKTQQVKETVDAYYRIYREADKIDVSNLVIVGEDEDGLIFGLNGGVKKKTKTDFMKHPPVFNPDDLSIRVIQDNKHLENKYSTSTNLYNYDTTLSVRRDDFLPRFPIEKITKKIVVRTLDNENVLVDLYVPSEASQFGKIDAIVISNLRTLMESKNYRSDLTDFMEFEWYSDKAWNSEDICHFKYDVVALIGMNLYDGNIVLTYQCKTIYDGLDLAEKHKTKELDEKYVMEAPKRDDVDIFAYARQIEKKKEKNKEIDINNLKNTTFTL